MVGGSKYRANILVDKHPSASIYYNDEKRGLGNASFEISRQDTDNIIFEVKKEGCETQSFNYTKRKIRPWALAGSILFWTGGTAPLLIPYGVIVDFAFGAIYKPDTNEEGVLKHNYKTYNYILNYTGCDSTESIADDPPTDSSINKEERLIALKSIYQDGLITKEEYEREKNKILNEQ